MGMLGGITNLKGEIMNLILYVETFEVRDTFIEMSRR